MAYRPLRQHRYLSYLAYGFLPIEASELSGVRYSEAPYLRKMMRDRLVIKRAFDKEAEYNKWSKTRREEEYRVVIRNEYIERGWIRVKEMWRVGRTRYQASPWEMLKTYRQRAIDTGEYHPVKGRRIRRVGDKIYIHIYKGDVQAQKERARTKLRASKGTSSFARYEKQRAEQRKRAKERKWAREH